jgi:hypothetical protein
MGIIGSKQEADPDAGFGLFAENSGHAASADQIRIKGGEFTGFATVEYADGRAPPALPPLRAPTDRPSSRRLRH